MIDFSGRWGNWGRMLLLLLHRLVNNHRCGDVRGWHWVFVHGHNRRVASRPVVNVVVVEREAGVDPQGVEIVTDRVIHCGGRLLLLLWLMVGHSWYVWHHCGLHRMNWHFGCGHNPVVVLAQKSVHEERSRHFWGFELIFTALCVFEEISTETDELLGRVLDFIHRNLANEGERAKKQEHCIDSGRSSSTAAAKG